LTNPDSEMKMNPKYATPARSWDVFRWPEFQAFAERLGIDLTQPIKDIIIRLPFDELAQYDLTLRGSDTKKSQSGMIDTTTLHNDKWRTKIPTESAGD